MNLTCDESQNSERKRRKLVIRVAGTANVSDRVLPGHGSGALLTTTLLQAES